MKDELDLLAHDTDEALPAEHERKIREGLAGLLAAGAIASSTASTPERASTATSIGSKGALGRALTVAAVVVAAGGGVVIGRLTAPSPMVSAPVPSLVAARSVPVATLPSAPPSIEPAPSIATSSAPSAVVAAPSSKVSPSSDAFDREQSLLERARSALVRHDAVAATQALDECERQFPRSKHAEERDYLRIQVLREKGDVEATRERARAFLTKYPDSLLRARVETLAH